MPVYFNRVGGRVSRHCTSVFLFQDVCIVAVKGNFILLPGLHNALIEYDPTSDEFRIISTEAVFPRAEGWKLPLPSSNCTGFVLYKQVSSYGIFLLTTSVLVSARGQVTSLIRSYFVDHCSQL